MSKKTVLSSIFAIALVTVAGMGIYKRTNRDINFSAFALNDIEALAQESGEEFVFTCGQSQGACWVSDFEPLPFGRYRVTCPYFSGKLKDSCVPGTYPI